MISLRTRLANRRAANLPLRQQQIGIKNVLTGRRPLVGLCSCFIVYLCWNITLRTVLSSTRAGSSSIDSHELIALEEATPRAATGSLPHDTARKKQQQRHQQQQQHHQQQQQSIQLLQQQPSAGSGSPSSPHSLAQPNESFSAPKAELDKAQAVKPALDSTIFGPPPSMTAPHEKNVLLLMSDDLRPSLSIYDVPHVITPNFARLAGKSVVFEHAYNQDPVCNPSRNSLLSGRRPDTTQVWYFETEYDPSLKGLFNLMRQSSNRTLFGSGKLHHWIGKEMNDFDEYWPESAGAWVNGTDRNYEILRASVLPSVSDSMNHTIHIENLWPEEQYYDVKVANKGIEYIHRAADIRRETSKPFLIGVGFHQPHRPWMLPRKYWDMYEHVPIPLPPHPDRPKKSPSVYKGDVNPSRIKTLEGQVYYHDLDKPHGNYPEEALREQMRGYYAAITFVDAQLGRILDVMEQEGLMDNTLIIWCVDHGLNIGDHGLWDKRTLLETTTRVPLIIHDPSYPATYGMRAPALVENVDIYPTILASLGMEGEGQKLWPPLEGQKLQPILADPKRTKEENIAYSQYPRCCTNCTDRDMSQLSWREWRHCQGHAREWGTNVDKVLMGYSMRTLEWRYNVWLSWNGTEGLPRWDQAIEAEELYDHRDPKCNRPNNFDACEDENIADQAEMMAIKDELRARLFKKIKHNNLPYHEEKRKAKNKPATS